MIEIEGALRTAGRVSRIAVIGSLCALVALTGCGGKKDKVASQTAAKVNKQEITVHQINFVLQQQRGVRPDQVDAASREVLERLIDQELALQKAEDMKLDRDARVQQQLEAARRDVIARAYLERISEGVGKPSPDEVRKFYDEKPALFKQRQIYNIQEINVEAKPQELPALRAKAESAKNANEFAEVLKANDVKFSGNQMVRTAESLPAPTLDLLSRMKEGQMTFNNSPTGAQIVWLAGVRSQPVAFEQAAPLIEQYLINERKRELIAQNIKQMRADAKIEYVGKYAQAAASAPAAAASAPTVTEAAASASPPPPAASNGLDNAAISKGMGIK
jgi:EpsD family peptidyl-prolyl cis-trans isomerase